MSLGEPRVDTSALARPMRTLSMASTQPDTSAPSSRSSSYTGAYSPTLSPSTAVPADSQVTPVATSQQASPAKVGSPPVTSVPTSPQPPAARTHSPSNASSTTKPPQRPSLPPAQERKSVFGKFFHADHGHGSRGHQPSPVQGGHESGGESDTSASSVGGALNKLGRRLSASTAGAKLDKTPANASQSDLTNLSRQPSGKLERRGSRKGEGDHEEKQSLAASLKELVAGGPKISRKASVTSRKSDDGKSEKGSTYGGDTHASKTGGESNSLLKKYGVCEKVAIGKGATAVVRLAHKWDRSTERLYAVKEFRKRRKNETEREYVKKLTSEFCISSTLHHAFVVETVDLVQDEAHHWCEVMEYCPGGDLYAAIKRGQMTQSEINSYFKQIICGVGYLHTMGVAHRDIKPENLLIDALGMVKITDFGVSDVFRMCWEKTTHLSKGLCGSEPYIAPEQFEQKEYDARLVDVWAIAIVFYCLNQQELPWRSARASDESYQGYLQAYNSSPSPSPLQALSPRECRAVIKRMLDPSTKTRLTCEQIIKDPWIEQIAIIDKDGKSVASPGFAPSITAAKATQTASVASLIPSHQGSSGKPRDRPGEAVRAPSQDRTASPAMLSGSAGSPAMPAGSPALVSSPPTSPTGPSSGSMPAVSPALPAVSHGSSSSTIQQHDRTQTAVPTPATSASSAAPSQASSEAR